MVIGFDNKNNFYAALKIYVSNYKPVRYVQ